MIDKDIEAANKELEEYEANQKIYYFPRAFSLDLDEMTQPKIKSQEHYQ